MADDALSASLRKAVDYLADAVRAKSPSALIAGRWRVTFRGDGSAHLINSAVSAVATNNDWHHYSWGHKPQIPTNAKDPGRTDWSSKAVDSALDTAVDRMADEYVSRIVVDL